MSKIDFEYKQNEKLQMARAQLKALRARNEQSEHGLNEKRLAVAAARRQLNLVEAKFALGELSQKGVQAARRHLERAQNDLAASEEILTPDNDAENYLFAQIEKYQMEEAEENTARFQPMYRAAIKKLDTALAAAAAANDHLADVRAACTRVGLSWPGPWNEFSGQENKYKTWRDSARRAGLL